MTPRRDRLHARALAVALAALALVLGGMVAPVRAADPMPGTLARVAAAVRPAVIHVHAASPLGPSPSERPPLRGFLQPSLDLAAGGTGIRLGLGSGVIIDPSGLALTNAHVVAHGAEVEVVTFDGVRRPARVVGSDLVTDLAVLRIAPAAAPFPALEFGDSDAVRVGDWVLAVGSPFGLEASVTAGIVSAKARHLGAGPFDDFLQTDAAINPGNSGGPLVDLEGRLIGINALVTSHGAGIGFAIPANLVRTITTQLVAHGRVQRGRIGVSVQPLTPALARTFGVTDAAGVLVADVASAGPAARAGVRAGDIVLAFDDLRIGQPTDLQRAVGLARPGQVVTVTVRRNGGERRLSMTVEDASGGIVAIAPSRARLSRLGFAVQPLTPGLAQRLGYRSVEGVAVTAVAERGEAAAAGVRSGDVIREVDRQPVRSMADFRRLTRLLRPGAEVTLRLERGGEPFFVAFPVP